MSQSEKKDKKGVVYTKRWVADLILDMVGYLPSNGIGEKTIIEPSCGSGAFLVPIAERRQLLCQGVRNFSPSTLSLKKPHIETASKSFVNDCVSSLLIKQFGSFLPIRKRGRSESLLKI